MTQGTVSFPFIGGLDLVTSPLQVPAGRVIAAINYEPIASGYRRLRGYERFDGHPAPSDATYWRIEYTNGTNSGAAPTAGTAIRRDGDNTIIGYVIAVVTSSGAWSGTAAGYIITTNLSEAVVGTSPHFNISPAPNRSFLAGVTTVEYVFGATLNAIYRAAAIAQARTNIAAVPGSGPVRGVWFSHDGNIIAFRDNAGATAGVMWKATTTGWTAVPVLTRIDFTCDTATQTLPTNILAKIGAGVANASVSTSDGTIKRVVIDSTVGTVNTGHFLVSGYVAASFTAGGQTIYLAGAATVLGTTTAAASTATIPAGGRYFFINHNFYGSDDLAATYMVNGVGQAIVYDGAGFANISTGMRVDTPTRLAAHRKSLFLAFPGGSLQFSSVGEPLSFDPILGAGEIGIGSEITDLIPANKSTLAVLGEQSINVLYGSDASDYLLETLTDEAGALPFTAQRVGQVVYVDRAGVRSLSSSAAYGNYNFGSLSQLIAPLLSDLVRDQVQPVASLIVRRRNQYWVFYENNGCLIGHLGRKQPEWLPAALGHDLFCCCSVEVDDVERMFFGSDDGFVYELDKGTSFDGDSFVHYVRFPFTSLGMNRSDKRVFEFAMSMETIGTTTVSASIDINFGSEMGLDTQLVEITVGAAGIDNSLGSNEEYYNSQIESEGRIEGGIVARNFSARISGYTNTEEPHTLVDGTYYLAPRRLVR